MKKILTLLLVVMFLFPALASANVTVLGSPGVPKERVKQFELSIQKHFSLVETLFSEYGINTDFNKKILILPSRFHIFGRDENLNNTYWKDNKTEFDAHYSESFSPDEIGPYAASDFADFIIMNNTKIAAAIPYWLQLGITEYMSEQITGASDESLHKKAYVRVISEFSDLPNILDLSESKTEALEYANKYGYRAYPIWLHSYLATKYLIRDVDKNPNSGIKYLSLLNQGKNHEESFKEAFGLTTKDFVILLEQYNKDNYGKDTKPYDTLK